MNVPYAKHQSIQEKIKTIIILLDPLRNPSCIISYSILIISQSIYWHIVKLNITWLDQWDFSQFPWEYRN